MSIIRLIRRMMLHIAPLNFDDRNSLFSYMELKARIRALLRRYCVYCGRENNGCLPESNYIDIDGIRIHKDKNEVLKKGMEINLTDKEYGILRKLMKLPNRSHSARNIFEEIWEEPYYYGADATIKAHIRNLRIKIEDIGTLIFMLVYYCGNALIDDYFNGSSLQLKMTEKRVNSFSDYVDSKNIAAQDPDRLLKWCEREPLVLMDIHAPELTILNGLCCVISSYSVSIHLFIPALTHVWIQF